MRMPIRRSARLRVGVRTTPPIAGFLLAALVAGALGVACRPRTGELRPGALPGDPDSLRLALARRPAPPGFDGRGRLHLEVGGEDHPVLDLRFAACPEGEARALLRPGVLAPVLSFWSRPAGWRLLLPRQRVAFVQPEPDPRGQGAATSPAGAAAAEDAAVGARWPGQLAWYLLTPRDLVLAIREPRVVATEGAWIWRGWLGVRGGARAPVEAALDVRTGGIARWSLHDSSGASLLRVAYDPPVRVVRAGVRTRLLLPALGARGALEWTTLEARAISPREPPAIPPGWEVLPASELPAYLETLLPSEE